MLKKSLIAIAVLAIALPAFAGDVKVHKPWPSKTIYSWQDVTVIDILMDVGYYIHITNQDAIKVSQTSIDGSDPFYTYSGCSPDGGSDVISNFDATLKGVVTSSLSGSWSATFNGEDQLDVLKGTTKVQICVTGEDVDITTLDGGADNVKVGDLTIKVIPTIWKDSAEEITNT